MKKLSLVASAIVALGLSSAAIADNNMPCAGSNLDGFYLGAGIGGDTYYSNWTYTNNHFVLPSDDYSRGNGSNVNILARINAGYGVTLNPHFYVGGEGWYQYMPANHNIFDMLNSVYVSHFDLKNTFGIGARAGFLPCRNLMFYGLLGVSTTDFSYNVSDSLYGDHSISHWTPGITPGVGVEYAINKHISLDARYTYTAYRSVTTNLTTADGTVDQIKVNPRVNAAALSINFRF